MLQLCCDFVIYDTELDVFRCAHLSVREFLEERPDCTTKILNSRAAEACLFVVTASRHPAVADFLLQHNYVKGYENDVDRRIVYPGVLGIDWLVGFYSKLYWPVHCQLAGGNANQSTLKIVPEFFMSSNIDLTWPYNVWYASMDRFNLSGVEEALGGKLMSSGPEPLFGAGASNLVDVARQKMNRISLATLEN